MLMCNSATTLWLGRTIALIDLYRFFYWHFKGQDKVNVGFFLNMCEWSWNIQMY